MSEQTKDEKPAEKTDKAAAAPAAAPKPNVKRLRGVHGRIEHPYTHVWFDTDGDGKKHDVDSWVQAQLDGGKLAIVTLTD